jgi:quercetin dioxygenase-like cupin family protein
MPFKCDEPAVPTVQHDDAAVRITRWDFAPGAATGWHTHGWPYFVVMLTDAVMKVEADGVVSEIPRKAGDSYQRPAGVEHDVMNGSPHPMAFVEIEIKRPEALASTNPLLGTWKLKSYIATSDDGVTSTPYGERTTGFLSYAADGRMQATGTSAGRIAPRNATVTDEQQAALFRTMFAYGGTYSLEAGKVTHHVDISWNETWNGTDQVRFYDVRGNTLTLSSTVVEPSSGRETQYVVVWDKV